MSEERHRHRHQHQFGLQFDCLLKTKLMPMLMLLLLFPLSPSRCYADLLRAVDDPPLVLDVPLLDLPFNVYDGRYTVPSMEQSLHLSTDFLQVGHYIIGESIGDQHGVGTRFANLGFDLISMYFPLGSAWLHEEWHRAVMTKRRVSSFNDVYNIPIGASVIAVSHVNDDDLIRFKRDHPAEFTRMSSAGFESEAEQNLELEKRKFFLNAPTFDRNVLWLNYLSNALYISSCAGGDVDENTDKQNNEDGRDVARRDFTGFDCTGWTYDLHRPFEPYQNRGPHPSGVGLNRYRKFSHLTEYEKDFLRLQAKLTWLNFLDPFLFVADRFDGTNPRTGRPFTWNLTLRHHLAPFGYALSPNYFYSEEKLNLLFTLNAFVNSQKLLPGADIQVIRYPMIENEITHYLSFRTAIWLQPADQLFHAETAKLGGLLSIRVSRAHSKTIESYWSLMGKSEGWVPGVLSLEADYQATAGINVSL